MVAILVWEGWSSSILVAPGANIAPAAAASGSFRKSRRADFIHNSLLHSSSCISGSRRRYGRGFRGSRLPALTPLTPRPSLEPGTRRNRIHRPPQRRQALCPTGHPLGNLLGAESEGEIIVRWSAVTSGYMN